MSDNSSQPTSQLENQASSDESGVNLVAEGAESVAAEQAADIQNDPNLTKAEKKAMLKELEIKFNGKAETVALPFEISEEHADWMRRQMQMAKLSAHSSQEKAALERDVTSFLQELKTNPRKALSNPAYGVDLRKVAAEILEEELAESQKSPEQIEREKFEKEKKEFYAEKERKEKEASEQKRLQEVEALGQYYDNAIADTLTKYEIPKTAAAIHRIAQYASYAIEHGQEPDMDLIGQKVEEEYADEIKTLLANSSREKRLKYIGEQIFEEERKERVAKVKQAPKTAKQVVDAGKVTPKTEAPKPKLTLKQRFGI